MSKAILIERLNQIQEQIDALRAEMIVAVNNHFEQPDAEYDRLVELANERLESRSLDREAELEPSDFIDALDFIEHFED